MGRAVSVVLSLATSDAELTALFYLRRSREAVRIDNEFRFAARRGLPQFFSSRRCDRDSAEFISCIDS